MSSIQIDNMGLYTYGAIGLTSIILAIITIYDTEAEEPAEAMSDSSEMMESMKSFIPSFSSKATPAVETAAASSLFGNDTSESASAPSSSLFGNDTSESASAPSLFGNETSESASAPSLSLFGNDTSESASAPSSSLFGNETEDNELLQTVEEKSNNNQEVAGGKRKSPRKTPRKHQTNHKTKSRRY